MKDLANLTKEREEKEQREIAKKLVAIATETVDFLKEKDLQVFETKTVLGLAAQQIDNHIQNKVQPMKISDLIPEKK